MTLIDHINYQRFNALIPSYNIIIVCIVWEFLEINMGGRGQHSIPSQSTIPRLETPQRTGCQQYPFLYDVYTSKAVLRSRLAIRAKLFWSIAFASRYCKIKPMVAVLWFFWCWYTHKRVSVVCRCVGVYLKFTSHISILSNEWALYNKSWQQFQMF